MGKGLITPKSLITLGLEMKNLQTGKIWYPIHNMNTTLNFLRNLQIGTFRLVCLLLASLSGLFFLIAKKRRVVNLLPPIAFYEVFTSAAGNLKEIGQVLKVVLKSSDLQQLTSIT
jgi:hypothetical protein